MNEDVDEYPAPPAYYKLFVGEKSSWPSPPPISPSTSEPFGGTLTVLPLSQQGFDPQKDYRAELNSRIDSLLAESLSVLSDVPSKIDGRQLIANLNISIDNINSTLNEFRVHEARELLCRSLESQLSELTALEGEMKRVLESRKALAQGQSL